MKKFYFLDKKGDWKGPYWLSKVLFFCLTDVINPSTYLWHTKLAKDIGNHPLQSIYARKAAYESLPIWFFWRNLRIIALNKWRKLKKVFKKDDWHTFARTPINTVLKGSVSAYLMPSISAINDFSAPRDYTIKLAFLNESEDPVVAEYPIELTEGNKKGICFTITMANPQVRHGVLYQESYGLDRQLTLSGNGRTIFIEKNSVFDFSTRFPFVPQILNGRFRQASTGLPSDFQSCYHRLVIKIDDGKVVRPLEIISWTGWQEYDNDYFNTEASTMGISFKAGGGFVEFAIDKSRYKIYLIPGDILVVDAIDQEDLLLFKRKAEVARVAFALLCGKFYGGECWYVSSNDSLFKTIDDISYEIGKESVISNRRLLDLRFFRSSFERAGTETPEEYKDINKLIDASLFSSLCDALWKDPTIYHAANLVTSGMGSIDPLQQGALYSVALEALTNSLGERKSRELKPISDPKLAKSFSADLNQILEHYEGRVSQEAYTVLAKNIAGINRPTNRDKLVKTFELFGITLSEEDRQAIDKRNDYLHGRSPAPVNESFDLTQITLKLHMLIVALLLKSVGYSGHIVNLDRFAYLQDEDAQIEFLSEIKKNLSEPYRELQQALKENDTARAKDLLAKLSSSLEDYKVKSFVRII